jgi:hypothetical protein
MPDPDHLRGLIDSLLYEGYALYPYTPTATKNATPTPFGIAYPPTYAASLASTFDHVELRCAMQADADAMITADVHALAPTGDRHHANALHLDLPPAPIEALTAPARSFSRKPPGATSTITAEGLTIELSLVAVALEPGTYEVIFRAQNLTDCARGLTRGDALKQALISTHPLLRVSCGSFISPLERPCASVNTFPVLATEDDDAILGATIVLPDHPQIAPESRGGMFDSTEIEEALLLHVKTLTDGELAEIEREDPHVREMIARAAAATPEDVLALHGRVTLRDPEQRERFTAAPPREPQGLPDPAAGDPEAEVDGVRFCRGGKVRLRPGEDADLHARMLDGRIATIERIMTDYDGKVHLGVTIDGDPGQDLLRESGRLLFFFAPEVEVLDRSGGNHERTP